MFVAHDPTSASPMHELLPLPQFSPPPLPPGPPSMSSIGTTTPVPPVCPPHTAREISLKVKVNTSPYKTFSKPHSSQKSKTKTKTPHLWCWPRALLWTGSCCPGSPATPSSTDPVFFSVACTRQAWPSSGQCTCSSICLSHASPHSPPAVSSSSGRSSNATRKAPVNAISHSTCFISFTALCPV